MERALGITGYFTGLAVGGELVLGVAIALLLHREFRGRGLVRVVLIMPMAATPVAMSLVWNMMMELGLLGSRPGARQITLLVAGALK